MGLLGPIKEKPKATRFCCVPFIRQTRAIENVSSPETWNMHRQMERNALLDLSCFFCCLLWGMHLYACVNTCVRRVSRLQRRDWEGRQGRGTVSHKCANLLCRTGGGKNSFPSVFSQLLGAGATNTGPTVAETRPLLEKYANPLFKFHFSNPFNQKQGNKASW